MAFRLRIPLLPLLITNLKKVCKVIDRAAPVVRPFVPSENQSAFDDALATIKASCEVIMAIEYADLSAETNAPWGER